MQALISGALRSAMTSLGLGIVTGEIKLSEIALNGQSGSANLLKKRDDNGYRDRETAPKNSASKNGITMGRATSNPCGPTLMG